MIRYISRLFPFLIALVMLSGCGYNTMQQNEEAVNRAWGDLESQLQRRSDLVPNLVATVKGAADFENSTSWNISRTASTSRSTRSRSASSAA